MDFDSTYSSYGRFMSAGNIGQAFAHRTVSQRKRRKNHTKTNAWFNRHKGARK